MSLLPWELENIIKSHIAAIRKAHHSHDQKRYALARLLERLFGIKPEEITMEKRTSDVGWIDLKVGNVIFEVKAVLEKELPKAREQLMKYIGTIYAEEGRVKTGIVTDGLKFIAYKPVIKRGRVVGLEEIGRKDIVVDDTYEFVSWLRSLIFPEERGGLGSESLFEIPEPDFGALGRMFGFPASSREEEKGGKQRKRESLFEIPKLDFRFEIPEPDFGALGRMFGFPASSREEEKGGKQRKRKR